MSQKEVDRRGASQWPEQIGCEYGHGGSQSPVVCEFERPLPQEQQRIDGEPKGNITQLEWQPLWKSHPQRPESIPVPPESVEREKCRKREAGPSRSSRFATTHPGQSCRANRHVDEN